MDSVSSFVAGINKLFFWGLLPLALPFGFIAGMAYIGSQKRSWPFALVAVVSGVITTIFVAMTGIGLSPISGSVSFLAGMDLGIGYTACFMAGRDQRIAALTGWLFGLIWAAFTICDDQTHSALSIGSVASNFLTTWVLLGLIWALFARGVLSIARIVRHGTDQI